ncbi:aldose epimerase [Pimelobacter simplex]|uniref:Putative aldose-1-epimerase n=1 Tax=Nocardioides simplex TaxID=2045 RepID=A0A0A1DIY8_NOCSI|nr:aldose 1-epimerase family protein [Pimelobacter simplex]AIY17356.1 putative aldose-1-epimerase [Pimelobacter simplex]MCG8151400.1 aldose epimerase [Pimelobacter simplex]GEB13415.1 galactose mutarotase [Pimelobacter simplex]SFM45058.1 aldose 1-epimerase [Pimelobacter simplex]
MSAPSGDQYLLAAHGYRAVVTQGGGALRALSYDGRDLVAGFAEDAQPSGGSGQLLVPWPNRIRDGRYRFAGTEQQLALTEPKRANASHGLVRWVAWTAASVAADRVVLSYFLPAQTGYPWALALTTTYALGTDGLTVTQAATNLAATAAPYASGAHPYLVAGPGPCDGWTLELPARTRLVTDDERLLPVGREPGDAFRAAAPIGDAVLNHAYTDLDRDGSGRATVTLRSTAGEGVAGEGVALWVDEHHRWLQVYTGDDTGTPRASVAVEPMTAPPDAFNSGDDLVVLEPGQSLAASWGLRAL